MLSEPLYIAGFGCRRGCSEALLRSLLEQALAEYGLAASQLAGLASIASKQDEPGLLALAQRLGLPLHGLPLATLQTYESRLSQHSPIALRETGCSGVAEASALAAAEALAGRSAQLRITKRSNARATFALACARRD